MIFPADAVFSVKLFSLSAVKIRRVISEKKAANEIYNAGAPPE
jgi:hypothetical protein